MYFHNGNFSRKTSATIIIAMANGRGSPNRKCVSETKSRVHGRARISFPVVSETVRGAYRSRYTYLVARTRLLKFCTADWHALREYAADQGIESALSRMANKPAYPNYWIESFAHVQH